MISKTHRTFMVLCIFIIAILFRFIDLSGRPMHGDEAINAYKVYELIETGKFSYQPSQHHGPLLFYISNLIFLFNSFDSINDLSVESLRSITCVVGVLLVFFCFIFKNSINQNTIYLVSGLMAVSPSLIYFSRYFIHEILMVFFSMVMIIGVYKYLDTGKQFWIIFIGIILGCMISTKETWPIFLIAMVISGGISCSYNRRNHPISIKNYIIIIGVSVLTAFLFYSDYFKDVNNSIDFFQAFKFYLIRMSSEGIHNHPWYFYLMKFFPFNNFENLLYLGEGVLFLIFIFSLPLVIFSENYPFIVKFLFWFSLTLFILFSLIPYKTPWNIISIIPGVIIVSANTINYQISNLNKKSPGKFFIVLLFCLLLYQSYSYNFKNESNPANPYVYSHPTDDIFKIEKKIYNMVNVLKNKKEFSIFIIATDHDYWPLPWYFRGIENIGYWDHIPKEVNLASIVIIPSSLETNLAEKFYDEGKQGIQSLLIPLFNEPIKLRSGLNINGWVKKEVYDLYKNLIIENGGIY